MSAKRNPGLSCGLTIILRHHRLFRHGAQLDLDVHDTNAFGADVDIHQSWVDGLRKTYDISTRKRRNELITHLVELSEA